MLRHNGEIQGNACFDLLMSGQCLFMKVHKIFLNILVHAVKTGTFDNEQLLHEFLEKSPTISFIRLDAIRFAILLDVISKLNRGPNH